MNHQNHFHRKQLAAEARLARLETIRQRQDANALPGSFVTGRSGQSAATRRKLDRQLERTISLAQQLNAARQEVDHWRRKSEAFDAGEINWQGRRVTKPAPKEPKRKLTLKERLFIGNGMTGIVFADRGREEHGNWPILALFLYGTAKLEYWAGCPEELKPLIEEHIAQYKVGDIYEVSACGQTITWGFALKPIPAEQPTEGANDITAERRQTA